MPKRSGYARVYFDPEPERGAHPGIRGEVFIDEIGVHYDEDTEWLAVDNESIDERWPMGDWCCGETCGVLPWHRVYALDWEEPESDDLAANGAASRRGHGDAS